MKELKKIFSLLLIAILLVPSNLVYASSVTDDIKGIDIRPKHDVATPGGDSLYYGYIELDQKFSTDTLNYTASVENDVKTVKIEATTVGNATVTGNQEYDLSVGENKINLNVTKSDGTNKTYTLVITRKGAAGDNNNLGYLYISGVDTNGNSVNLLDNFDPNITTYNIVVENENSEITVSALPEENTSTTSYTKNSQLKTGQNKIEIKVKSKSGSEKIYVINIERKASSDNSVLFISIDDDDINVGNKTNFTKKVKYDTSIVNISATVSDASTDVTGVGYYNLKVGKNKIKLTAIAENGNKVEYNITITRSKPTTEIDYVMINESNCGFNQNKLSIDVAYATDKAEIKAKTIDKSAKVTGNGTYKLKVGKNTFHLKVKVADGKTKLYTINITRLKYKSIIIIVK